MTREEAGWLFAACFLLFGFSLLLLFMSIALIASGGRITIGANAAVIAPVAAERYLDVAATVFGLVLGYRGMRLTYRFIRHK